MCFGMLSKSTYIPKNLGVICMWHTYWRNSGEFPGIQLRRNFGNSAEFRGIQLNSRKKSEEKPGGLDQLNISKIRIMDSSSLPSMQSFQSRSKRSVGKNINFGHDKINVGEHCLIPLCFAWQNAKPSLLGLNLQLPEACMQEINSKTLCRSIDDKTTIMYYVVGRLEPKSVSGKLLFSIALSSNAENEKISRHEIVMESLFHLTFFKPVSTTHINGAEISIIMNPGLEIANEEVSAVCPVEEERVENLKMIEVNIPTPVTVEVEELERAGGNVNESCGDSEALFGCDTAVENDKDLQSATAKNATEIGEVVPECAHNVEQQEMEPDGGNGNANTVDDSINCNLLQLSRAQEQDDKVKEITEEKESLILLRTQIRQDYGKEGLSEETKKSMNDQLSKIKNRLKVLAKKSQLITLSPEEVARLKSAHAQKQREYKMREKFRIP